LPMSVARSSSGMLTTGRIACRQEGGDGGARSGRSVIYDCLDFDCASNISGTAERICAKFTGRTCLFLARMSLNVKIKGQRSSSSGTKKRA